MFFDCYWNYISHSKDNKNDIGTLYDYTNGENGILKCRRTAIILYELERDDEKKYLFTGANLAWQRSSLRLKKRRNILGITNEA